MYSKECRLDITHEKEQYRLQCIREDLSLGSPLHTLYKMQLQRNHELQPKQSRIVLLNGPIHRYFESIRVVKCPYSLITLKSDGHKLAYISREEVSNPYPFKLFSPLEIYKKL